jgi:dynein intermediate chain 1
MLSALGLGKPKELPRKPSSRNVGTNSQIKQKSGSRIQIGKKGGGIMLDAGTKKLMNRNSGQLIKKLSGFLLSIGKSATDVGEDNPPTERIELTPAQLEEDMPGRVLEARDPCATQVSISYSYITNAYEKKTNYDQLVIHFEMDGETILKESEEAKIQEEIDENRIHLIRETVKHHELMDSNQEYDLKQATHIMKNKFNYSERQSQTPVQYVKERGLSTQRLKLLNYCGEVTQAWIFDLFYEDWMTNVKEDDSKNKKGGATEVAYTQGKSSSIYSGSFKRCLKIMERMIVQNEEEDKFSDYKYMFTEKGPEISKSKEKNIYPLWRFLYPPNKKKNVTCICWNPHYSDMFAVGFGSYDFGKKKSAGSICMFSIKNTNYPEMIFQTDDSVMSLDFHPKSNALLAVGLYDGVVLVYDVRNRNKLPIYSSSVKTKKHSDPVWQIMWNPDISIYFNFYSISSDGRVMNWILMKDKLEPEEVIKLKLVNKKNKQNDEETSLISLACGLCFDFNKFDPFTFIVGTEEGNIHKCSKAYSGQYQETYDGHQLAIYKIRWNPFHKRTFISASADWTVKIWDSRYKSPVMSFDLGQAMVDVMWSPFSASVFVALSLEKTYVYDLREDRHTRIAENKPVKSKCTNLAWNWQQPVILVGDSHGGVNSFKLSKH